MDCILSRKSIIWLDKLGEIAVYLFIVSIFVDTKLALKVGYILQGLSILKIIFDYKNIKIRGKEIYMSFIFILLVGIIFSYISSQYMGAYKFVSINIKFINGLMLLLFIKNKKSINNILYTFLAGGIILSLGMIFNFDFIKLDIIHQRSILLLPASLVLMYFLESLKKYFFYKKSINKIFLFFCFISILIFFKGIAISMSRMAFLSVVGILGLYFLYSLIELRKFWKIFFVIGILGISMGYFSYTKIKGNYIKRISTSFNTKDNLSNIYRIIMWEGSIEAFKTSPITGVGISFDKTLPFNKKAAKKNIDGKYEKYKKIIEKDFIEDNSFPEGHSIYFNLLAKVGSLTLVYLFLFFYQIPKKFFKGNKTIISVASFFTILSFFIYGTTWSIWTYYGSTQKLFQIILALLIISSEDFQN